MQLIGGHDHHAVGWVNIQSDLSAKKKEICYMPSDEEFTQPRLILEKINIGSLKCSFFISYEHIFKSETCQKEAIESFIKLKKKREKNILQSTDICFTFFFGKK